MALCRGKNRFQLFPSTSTLLPWNPGPLVPCLSSFAGKTQSAGTCAQSCCKGQAGGHGRRRGSEHGTQSALSSLTSPKPRGILGMEGAWRATLLPPSSHFPRHTATATKQGQQRCGRGRGHRNTHTPLPACGRYRHRGTRSGSSVHGERGRYHETGNPTRGRTPQRPEHLCPCNIRP